MEQGIVDLAPFGPMVPEAVQKKVSARKADLKAGKDTIFTGPIKDQSGKVRIADGVQAADKELLGMTWFVHGVVGTTE
jgi:basic membrane protein A